MKFKSQVYTQTSGSIGGITYAHNQGGLYTRNRSIPINPNSPQQATVRNQVSALTARWVGVLTAAQRAAWDLFAFNVPIIGVLGDPVLVSGLNWYVKINVQRVQSGLTRIDTAPGIFALALLTAPSFTVSAAADTAAVTFDNTDAWAGEIGGALITYFSRPVTQSINYFKGPYRFAANIAGAVSPPTSPATITLPFPIVVGQRVFGRFVAVRADGRPSTPFRSLANS
jgi:hypothetical protein